MELNDGKIKVLAYYLPQFHPTPENDRWWGEGFTEWTNVGRAKPLFKGHYQPKVPADLGYYDLRVPEVADRQAHLAREGGVAGFCYWHYWFGNGRKLLEMPAERMLATGQPDFPFCFAWANHSWWRKSWNPQVPQQLLLPQTYPGDEDVDAHFYYCLPFFRDKRYVRYDDRPVFIFFKHWDYPEVDRFMSRWNELARKERLSDGIYFIANVFHGETMADAISLGMSACALDVNARKTVFPPFHQRVCNKLREILHMESLFRPEKIDYSRLIKEAWEDDIYYSDEVIPVVFPNWDHTPRSGKNGTVYINTNPENFGRMLEKVFSRVATKDNKLVILKSWNEWGEGNYMEPDLRYGHGFLEALRRQLERFNKA